MQSKKLKQPTRVLKKKCLQSQLHLQDPIWLRFLSMMVDGQPKNMLSCCTTSPRTSMHGIKFDCKSHGTGSKQMRELSSYLIWRKKGDVQKLQNMKHINGVSKNGKLSSRLESWTMQHFQAVPLLKELRRCVYFQKSMRLFVRMIQE